MRINVKKFLFFGHEKDKSWFFKKAQEEGIVQFIENKQGKEVPASIADLNSALKVLRGLPVMEQEELEEPALGIGLAHKILHLKVRMEKLEEEKRILNLEMERVHVFGDFSKEDLLYIEHKGKRCVQFFFSKHGLAQSAELPDTLMYIGTEHEMDYYISFSEKPRQYDQLVEMRIDQPLGSLKRQLDSVEQELHHLHQNLKGYAKYRTFLHKTLLYKLNSHHLSAAESSADSLIENSLFAISGWAPVNKLDQLHRLADGLNVQIEEVAIDPEDAVPTYLENHGANKIGEDVIKVYDTPSSTDKDPSLWVLLSFALFFAFIVGDAGYGLVLLAVSCYLQIAFSKEKGLKKRLIHLFTILSLFCVIWGLLTNSLLGVSFTPSNPVRNISLLNWLVHKKAAYHLEGKDEVHEYWLNKFPHLTNVVEPKEFVANAVSHKNGNASYELLNQFSDNILLELALFIGAVHIIISLLRYAGRNLPSIGWIAFIIGCYLYFPYYLNAPSLIHYAFGLDFEQAAANGLYLIAGGILLALVLAVIKNKLLGLTEIMNVIQIFSDVLSYLRLYALALAGAIVTTTINEIAGAIPFVFGILLLVIGHGINLALAIMGGVLHGLRLNFLEWYHYSFEGSGKKFKPLHKMQIE